MGRKFVMAVHRWETGSGKHEVAWHTGKRTYTKTFSRFPAAETFAEKKAEALKLKQYQVDTPKRPHVMVNVKAKKEVRKRTAKKLSRRKKPRFPLFGF